MRLPGFVRRHEKGEEKAAEVVGIWAIDRVVSGLLGAGVAAAATATVLTVTAPSKVYHPPYVLSQKGAALIERNEGVRYHPYNDATAPPVCTEGVGHAIRPFHRCSAAELRETLTPAQVMTLLLHDVSWAQNAVREKITRRISQPQFDALVDLVFNAGPGVLDYSGIASEINRGELGSVPGTLARTAVTAGHVYLEGLHHRRLGEAALFAHGFYGAGIGYYLPPKPLTAAQRKAAAKAAAKKLLRARTGYWAWLDWQLGAGPWKPYGKQNAGVRPSVPRTVTASWWRRERAFLAARHT